jgi:hypothetical protein
MPLHCSARADTHTPLCYRTRAYTKTPLRARARRTSPRRRAGRLAYSRRASVDNETFTAADSRRSSAQPLPSRLRPSSSTIDFTACRRRRRSGRAPTPRSSRPPSRPSRRSRVAPTPRHPCPTRKQQASAAAPPPPAGSENAERRRASPAGGWPRSELLGGADPWTRASQRLRPRPAGSGAPSAPSPSEMTPGAI